MSRVRAFLDRIDDPGLPPLEPGDPRDGPLLELLVHLAAVDGMVQDDEFALLQRLRADLEPGELLSWAADVASRPLDLDAVVTATSSVDERWDVLRFAARMVGMDGTVDAGEEARLNELGRKLGLPSTAARKALEEVVAPGGPVEETRAREALREMRWERLVPSHEAPSSDLAKAAPPESAAICSIRLGDEEVAALFPDGLLVRFDEGPAFVRWVDLRGYTRVPVPEAAFHVRTWEGRTFAASDERMRELGVLMDRIYGRR